MSNFAQLKQLQERKMSWKLLIPILCLLVSASSRPTSDSDELEIQTRGLVGNILDSTVGGMPFVGPTMSGVGDVYDSLLPIGGGPSRHHSYYYDRDPYYG